MSKLTISCANSLVSAKSCNEGKSAKLITAICNQVMREVLSNINTCNDASKVASIPTPSIKLS